VLFEGLSTGTFRNGSFVCLFRTKVPIHVPRTLQSPLDDDPSMAAKILLTSEAPIHIASGTGGV
jgi:hypothetical protein